MSVDPVAPYRLPNAGRDGVARRRGGLLERIVREDDSIVLLRAARPHREGPVVIGAWAEEPDLAQRALDRWRRVLGVDVDHRPFLDAAWNDPVLGPLVRRRPWLRPNVRYRPHEALMWAIAEQLIEFDEAVLIQAKLVRAAGVRCERTGLRDVPTPAEVLRLAPAEIERMGLSARRTLLLRETCRLLVRGLDLDAEDQLPVWRRLRSVPGLGAWTLSCLALRGQGEPDASPSGDLGLLKAVGRLMHEGLVELSPAPAMHAWDHSRPGEWTARAAGTTLAPDPPQELRRDRRGRTPLATEQQVHELVSRFSPWRGYAAEHLFMV